MDKFLKIQVVHVLDATAHTHTEKRVFLFNHKVLTLKSKAK